MVKNSSVISRCQWVPTGNKLYEDYHDHEWGIPVHDDRIHFEFLILEGAQAGLSWLTILKKREGYREAFAHFDPLKVAAFTEKDLEYILLNANVVKNKLKVRSAVSNAKVFLKIQEEFGSFDNYIWSFVGYQTIQGNRQTLADVPAETEESKALSKDLKKRGMNFVGSKVMYAHMQATGLVNDHTHDCFRCAELASLKS